MNKTGLGTRFHKGTCIARRKALTAWFTELVICIHIICTCVTGNFSAQVPWLVRSTVTVNIVLTNILTYIGVFLCRTKRAPCFCQKWFANSPSLARPSDSTYCIINHKQLQSMESVKTLPTLHMFKVSVPHPECFSRKFNANAGSKILIQILSETQKYLLQQVSI